MRILLAPIVMLMIAAAAVPMVSASESTVRIAQAQEAAVVDGTYDVHGTNRNGTKYTGTAVIGVKGSKVSMVWLISSGQTYKGKGTIKNGRMVVYFGSRDPVIYTLGAKGVLYGEWDRGRASETLIPK